MNRLDERLGRLLPTHEDSLCPPRAFAAGAGEAPWRRLREDRPRDLESRLYGRLALPLYLRAIEEDDA